MSITQQKSDLRAIIHKRIEKYLEENPGEARYVAIGAVICLSRKMTLKELQDWHTALYSSQLVKELDPPRSRAGG